MAKIGRNDPCPCGSGKKYKKCCLSADEASSRESAAWDRVLEKLLEFVSENAHEELFAARDFYLEIYPEDVGAIASAPLMLHCCCGIRAAGGPRIVDRFLSERSALLLPEELEQAELLAGARASVFEVDSCMLGQGVRVTDLLLKRQLMIHDVSLSGQLSNGDIFYGWIGPKNNRTEATGEMLRVPGSYAHAIFEKIESYIDALEESLPDASDEEIATECAWIAVAVLADPEPKLPVLTNRDGDEILISRAHFAIVKDSKKIREILNDRDELSDHEDGTYAWLDIEKNEGKQDGASVLGSLQIRDRKLVLETNSRPRLEDGKNLLLNILETLIKHKTDTFEDFGAKFKRQLAERGFSEANEPKDPDIPEEELQRVLHNYIVKQYENWADEPVPMLENKTPREVCETAEGRKKVARLLQTYQRKRRAGTKTPDIDFSFLWDELNLAERIAADLDFTYDPDKAVNADEWLALDEIERLIAVEAYHDANNPPSEVEGNSKLHATIHAIVENQLAAGNPEAVTVALFRLIQEGGSRHEAIHVIGSVVAEEMYEIMKGERSFDKDGISRKLEALKLPARCGPALE